MRLVQCLRILVRALDWAKDPEPDHWKTINGSHVHRQAAEGRRVINHPRRPAPPQAPKEAHDSNPFYHTASDGLDANGDNHDPSNGSFATKGTGGGKKSLNDLKHTACRANLSPSGANSISVKGVCDKTRHDIHVNKHLKKEAAFAGMSEDEYISEGG